jgi:hypothetical protein
MRKAIFHRKSDNAMFDSIAVSRGSGSCNRDIAACAIGLLRLTTARQIPRLRLTSKHRAMLLTDGNRGVPFPFYGKLSPTRPSASVFNVNKFAIKV